MQREKENMAVMDDMHALWKKFGVKNSLCLCVSGSVARGEQTAHSDTDILLLYQETEGMEEGTTATGDADEMLRYLHREGSHISVISRSLQDCLDMMDEDVRSWVSQMDATYVEGNRELFADFRRGMCLQAKTHRMQLLEALFTLAMERHGQYGETLALLEPNIKNSAGALRDIHTIYYMSLLMGSEQLDCEPVPWPEVRSILRTVQLQELRREQLLEAYDFLLRTRQAMHDCSGHLHDTLDFDLQREVAAEMGYGDASEKKGVEAFMRHYYRHAHTVHVALQLLFSDLGLTTRLEMLSGSNTTTGEDVMELFLQSCREKIPVSIGLVRRLDGDAELRFDSAQCRAMFDEILRQPAYVYATLSRMHEMRILGRLLPEFRALSQYFQHNIYHFFTADEHTLRCLRSVEEWRERGDEHVAVVLREIEDISPLRYALLLHDIAKPIDLKRHEIVGADMCDDILRRFNRMDIADDVRFLVHDHLRMEQLAFRRNFRDLAALQPFTERVENLNRLRLLYVLTCADMSALNPGVLTEWKKDLLAELYEAAKHHLLQDDSTEQISIREGFIVEEATSMEHHQFNTSVDDILDGELMRMSVTHHRSYSEVTIFCVDRPKLLSQLSAAFFAADASIVDAAIETRNDVVIDMFRVVDIISGNNLGREQTRELRDIIRSMCAGECDVEQLYTRSRRKWIRRLRKMPRENIKTAVEYIPHTAADGARQTIVEVYAPDTFGLLYRLAGELSEFGLNVVFAKIATRVDGVVDSFYVVDSAGNPLDDEVRKQDLRSRLLRQINEMTQQ
ncbi:HD domain-containing protein [bacterium]|nr:HD domain-containing protein [bacterium]